MSISNLQKRLQNPDDFFLSPRRRRGERTEERGNPNDYVPPLPVPLLHRMEEREKNVVPLTVLRVLQTPLQFTVSNWQFSVRLA
jgi:hypothetical protein